MSIINLLILPAVTVAGGKQTSLCCASKRSQHSVEQNVRNFRVITNPNYGVFDIETFIDTDNTGNNYSRVFALGFATSINGFMAKKKIVTTYYLTD